MQQGIRFTLQLSVMWRSVVGELTTGRGGHMGCPVVTQHWGKAASCITVTHRVGAQPGGVNLAWLQIGSKQIFKYKPKSVLSSFTTANSWHMRLLPLCNASDKHVTNKYQIDARPSWNKQITFPFSY
jgi:hypothetical protein